VDGVVSGTRSRPLRLRKPFKQPSSLREKVAADPVAFWGSFRNGCFASTSGSYRQRGLTARPLAIAGAGTILDSRIVTLRDIARDITRCQVPLQLVTRLAYG
jgi:hypothetical protein